jgi:hypothetical protein
MFFSQTFQNRNNFLTEKYIFNKMRHLFDATHGFSCQVIEFVLQFSMIYSMRVFFSD